MILWMMGCAPSADRGGDVPAGSDPPATTDPSPTDEDGDGVPAGVDCDDGDPDVGATATVDGTQFYADLGQALDEAASGAEIVVCAGTYDGGLVARVPVALSSIGGPVTLSGGDRERVLSLAGGSSIVGFTLERGAVDGDGGGLLVTSGTVTAADLVVTDNVASRGGGIAVAVGAELVLSGSVVRANRAQSGGGLYVDDGGRAELVDTSVEGNQADTCGGGVHLVGAELVGGDVVDNAVTDDLYAPEPSGGGGVSAVGTTTVTGTVVRDNTAAGDGGGILVAHGELTSTDVSVLGNVAAHGGGLAAVDAVVHLITTTVEGNQASTFGGGGYLVASSSADGGVFAANTCDGSGGGVWLFESDLSGSTVTGNSAPLDGGGVWAHVATLTDIDVSGNATVGNGGGVLGSWLVLVDARITDNTAGEEGGGVHTIAGPAEVTGGAITGNEAAVGGGLFLDDGTGDEAEFRLAGVAVTGNTATVRGGGAALAGMHDDGVQTWTGGSLVSDGSDWVDNVPGDVSTAADAPEVTYGPDASFVCTAVGCVRP